MAVNYFTSRHANVAA